jgi:hypothetical protein
MRNLYIALLFFSCMLHCFVVVNASETAGGNIAKSTQKCPDKIHRAIVGHHKLGLTVARRFVTAVKTSTGCDIKLLSGFVPKKLMDYTVVSLIQNPFDYLISTYMHHKRGL